MEMIERVARALEAAFEREGRVFDAGQADDLARAAIEAIFAGSRMTEFRDGIVIANPDFPVHFWNGTSMEEVKPADPHAARIGE